jgi:hypothetical protein
MWPYFDEFTSLPATLTSFPKCIIHLKAEQNPTLEGRSHEDAISLENGANHCCHGFDGQLHVDGDISLGKGPPWFKFG